jgi:Tol biopolymer transport system component
LWERESVLPENGALTFALVSGSEVVLTAPADAPEAGREVIRGSNPVFSPDGKTIYFVGADHDDLWSASFGGQEPRQLVPEGTFGWAGPSLSPDGSLVAYSRAEEGQTVVYTQPTGGGAPWKMYAGEGSQGMVSIWSPDGQELAFGDGPDLMVVPASGGSAIRLAASTGSWDSSESAWSPDGKSIAGLAYEDDGTVLYLVDRQTGETKRLTPPEETGYKQGLSWHPDGNRISYRSHTMDGTSEETRVVWTTGARSVTLPGSKDQQEWIGRWGPDLRYYYITYVEGEGAVYVFDEETAAAEPFIRPGDGRYIYRVPSWSGDGSSVTWSEGTQSQQLWMVTDHN